MPHVLLSYLIVYLVWSTTAFAIKLGVMTIPPFYLFGVRFLIGGIILLGYAYITGRLHKIPARKDIINSIVIGLLLLIGGNGLISVALIKIDSYLAALLISTIPIFVLIFDRIILKKKIKAFSIIGLVLGMLGVIVLIYNPGQGGVMIHPYIVFVILAVILWSFAMSLSKKLSLISDNILNSGIQQLATGIISLVSVQFFQPVFGVSWNLVDPVSIKALIYLSLIGNLAVACFIYLLKVEPNERAVSYNFVCPLGSAFVGIIIGGETIVPGLFPGAILILSGLAVVFYGDRLAKKIAKVSL